ncbi:MAG: hypothetical protein EXQ87_11910 [Alphaproteobacteria bacterium]|nr:hypothetical protein [Alphaproteobacteria bacterium]
MIALAILSLISGVLVDAFGRVVDVRVRLSERLRQSGEAELAGDWFRHSVGAIVPEAASTTRADDGGFLGLPQRFVAVTRMSLEGIMGEPIRGTWEIAPNPRAGGMVLRYVTETGHMLEVASWRGERGGFLYYGRDGIWRRTWPPAAQEASQLPLLVRAEIGEGALSRSIVAAPRGTESAAPGGAVVR